jgi:ABC-type branched-subunit amino acid transport system substrate-binding protein
MRQLLWIGTGLLLSLGGLAQGACAALGAPAAPRPAATPAAPAGTAAVRQLSLPEQRVFSAAAYASTLCLIRSGRLSHGDGMAQLGQTLQQNGIDRRLLGSSSVNAATRLLEQHLKPDCLSSQLSQSDLIRKLTPLVQ